jgi:bacteriochlorophyllide a dehydrogenase
VINQTHLSSQAVLLRGPQQVALQPLTLFSSGPDDLLVDVHYSSISSGTERLLWDGSMPHFPGMGYPLVPGYESVGVVRSAPSHLSEWLDKRVFVPGTQCYGEIKGLFGASSSRLLVSAKRAVQLPAELIANTSAAEPTLLALAATARHMIQVAGPAVFAPDAKNLIVGHGVLGRLVARLLKAMGAAVVVVCETNPQRIDQANAASHGYSVVLSLDDASGSFQTIFEVSGDAGQIDQLIRRLAPGAQIILGGFYSGSVQFCFAPAFMREAQIRVAAQWQPADLQAVVSLVAQGQLSLAHLLTHTCTPTQTHAAYEQAFGDSQCLKMVLDWSRLL